MTVTTLRGTCPAKMVGGPMAKQTGEVVTPAPEWLYFGANGGFCYRLDANATPRKIAGRVPALYRYDRQATAEKLKLLGIPLSLVDQAVSDDATALQMTARPEGYRERPEIGGSEVDVRIELHADEWQVWVAGELEHTLPRGSIDPDDAEAVREAAQQAGSDFIKANGSATTIEGELA